MSIANPVHLVLMGQGSNELGHAALECDVAFYAETEVPDQLDGDKFGSPRGAITDACLCARTRCSPTQGRSEACERKACDEGWRPR